MGTFNTIPHFKFWCQKVLPLVYDDSLSYMELLCKVINYLNHIIDDVNQIPNIINELISDEKLKEVMTELLDELREQVARANEGTNTTASYDRTTGELVWLNGKLIVMTRDILAGDRYVEEVDPNDDITGNFVYTSIENEMNKLKVELNNSIQTAVTELEELISSEAETRAEADTLLQGHIDDEATARAEGDELLQTAINNIKIPHIVDVTNVGAVGDGLTDNTTILQDLIDEGDVALYFPTGTYVIGELTITNNCKVYGDGDTSVLIPLTADETMFTLSNEKSFECYSVCFDGTNNSFTAFSFNNVVAPKIHDISFINVAKGFDVNGSRSLRINNIWQVGDCANKFYYNGSNYNFDTIVDGWQVDTNSTPSQADPWFDLSGMVCTLWSNLVTQGRMECDGFDIHGFNEGTFFNNIVLVCPKNGFNIHKKSDEVYYPGCVQLDNVSVDQYYTSGIKIEGYWIMVNNSAFVNGSQRNATDSAIIIYDEAIRVFFNNVISYNNSYQMFNIGAAKHVKISNCIGYNSEVGAVYVCPTQSFDNPQVVNCTFESVNANGLTMKNGSFNHIVTAQGVTPISLTESYQNVYEVTVPASSLESHQVIELMCGIQYNNTADIRITVNGTNLDLSHSSGDDLITLKMLKTVSGYIINAINKEGTAYASTSTATSLVIEVKAKSSNSGTLYGSGFAVEVK